MEILKDENRLLTLSFFSSRYCMFVSLLYKYVDCINFCEWKEFLPRCPHPLAYFSFILFILLFSLPVRNREQRKKLEIINLRLCIKQKKLSELESVWVILPPLLRIAHSLRSFEYLLLQLFRPFLCVRTSHSITNREEYLHESSGERPRSYYFCAVWINRLKQLAWPASLDISNHLVGSIDSSNLLMASST